MARTRSGPATVSSSPHPARSIYIMFIIGFTDAIARAPVGAYSPMPPAPRVSFGFPTPSSLSISRAKVLPVGTSRSPESPGRPWCRCCDDGDEC
jgi:hypothetical protein